MTHRRGVIKKSPNRNQQQYELIFQVDNNELHSITVCTLCMYVHVMVVTCNGVDVMVVTLQHTLIKQNAVRETRVGGYLPTLICAKQAT